MKIGFFGTPEIGAFFLERLCDRHEIAFVVSSEDKPSGRDLHMTCCPVTVVARCKNLTVLHPKNLRDPELIATLGAAGADVFVVVAYGRIIPREVFDMPRLGTVNVHPSLLPRYRGAAPIPWALVNGETETGVTIQRINERLDAGDIILQEKIAVGDTMTAADLFDILMPLGYSLLERSLELLASGAARPVTQDESAATYCGKITRETAHIDWSAGAVRVHNLVRGMHPKPVAWTSFREKQVKIFRTAPFHEDPAPALEPGELGRYQKKRLLVGTGEGILEVLSLQPENKKVLDGLSFINGYRLAGGERFQ